MPEPRALERECTTLSRYLVGSAPPRACVDAYLRAHAGAVDGGPGAQANGPQGDGGAGSPGGGAAPSPPLIDRWTVWLGRRGGAVTRCADAYCTLFRRGGALRRKVTLTLAILEHAPPHHADLHSGSGTGPARAWIGLTGTGLAFALAVAAGLVVCGPAHLLSAVGGSGSHG
jgi:hypothetical protein